jgi:Predicted nucleotide-binding protein containing TIR-like domain
LTLDEAEKFLKERVALAKDLTNSPVEDMDGYELLERNYELWHDYNQEWLQKYLPYSVGLGYQMSTIRGKIAVDRGMLFWHTDRLRNSIKSEITKLESIIQRLPLWTVEQSKDTQEPSVPPIEEPKKLPLDAPVFIVHGRDTNRAQLVARAVERAAGREVIILREQASGGRTLIEKFEDHAQEASYAIVLITADDLGGPKDGPSQPRGRQNVIFEMGYFYGRIGRGSVCVLLDSGVEQPSDMTGIVYIEFASDGTWKQELFREMQHAGFDINWSRIPS